MKLYTETPACLLWFEDDVTVRVTAMWKLQNGGVGCSTLWDSNVNAETECWVGTNSLNL